jgi:hypothetical protein
LFWFLVIVLILFLWFVYDKYIQRSHQLLKNYPVIGRLRYLFEELREPLRQYFGDEKFYESKDKLDWVYKAARDLPNYASFAPSQPLPKPKFMIKHATVVYNDDEVGKKVMDPLLQKFNKLTVSKTIKVMDPEQKEVKVTLITLSDDSITKKETNKGSVGTNAVSKILSRIVTKDDVELWTPQNPITVA